MGFFPLGFFPQWDFVLMGFFPRSDVGRIKQLLTNNNYPMAMIDKAVNDFLQKKLATTNSDDNSIEPLSINLFFLNQISAQYKQDEKQLTQIIYRNSRTADNGKVKLNIYYKNKNSVICL